MCEPSTAKSRVAYHLGQLRLLPGMVDVVERDHPKGRAVLALADHEVDAIARRWCVEMANDVVQQHGSGAGLDESIALPRLEGGAVGGAGSAERHPRTHQDGAARRVRADV